ncbi:hypothetical protein K7432_016039, partial [Basidiobolus ranarum]
TCNSDTEVRSKSLAKCSNSDEQVNCKSPGEQVQELKDFILKEGLGFRILWIDLEGDNRWCEKAEENQYYLNSLRDVLVHPNLNFGNYTQQRMWNAYFPATYSLAVPLWNIKSIFKNEKDNTFKTPESLRYVAKSFGNWQKAGMEPYTPNQMICGSSWD